MKGNKLKLYPSSMTRVMNCTASKNKPDIEIDTTSQVTIEGTAYHEAMDILFNGDKRMEEVIAVTEEKYEVKIGFMVYNTFRIIAELEKKGVHLSETEKKIIADYGEYQISGKYDARGEMNEFCILVDYKGGYKDTSATDQLISYASIINKNEGIKDFKIITIYGRLNTYEVMTVNQEMIKEFDAKLQRSMSQDRYKTGEWCGYCPSQYECPAKTLLINNAVQVLGNGDLMKNPADLWDKVKDIKRAIVNYEEQFKDYVIENGEVSDSDGRVFHIKETEAPQYNPTPEVIGAIKERLGDNYFEDQPIKKTALKQTIMEHTERGLKKKEWEAFEEKLQEFEGSHYMKQKQTLTRKK